MKSMTADMWAFVKLTSSLKISEPLTGIKSATF